ncbi:MAG: T9SS type A sorting domain-containing protein [Bacteroidetes bacterium]|nr:T9SS type A sorting domain-containing protein [Bacteroidota bacterium]
MIKKRLAKILITPLVWLLLLCSSQMRVEAQDTIIPKLILSKSEIDICNNTIDREFTLSIDIGSISQADSLIGAEIVVLCKANKTQMTGYLKEGTLFGQFNDDYIFYKYPKDSTGQSEYDTIIMQGTNIIAHVSGNMLLVHFTGRIMVDTIDCADFIIESIYLGSEFTKPYISEYPDSTKLCLVNKNLPERKISIAGVEESYKIDSLDEVLKLDFFVEVTNKKNLTDFNFELSVDKDFLENIIIVDIYSDNILNKINDTSWIVNVNNIDTGSINSTKILTLEIIRNNAEAAKVNVKTEIKDINDCSCSMNGDIKNIEIDLPKIVSIVGDLDEGILILEGNDIIILKSNDEIIECKVVDLNGLEIKEIKRVGESELLFDKTQFASGVYFIVIRTNNKHNHLQYIKLIIN